MNPVLVNGWRGNAIENRFRGAVAVVDSSGRRLASLGDVHLPVFPRSSIKFIQAIPFAESGAIKAFNLDARHLALACASHNGEPIHIGLARHWLEQIGLDQEQLECGATLPSHEGARCELLAEGRGPQRIQHPCSGKHLGMLSILRHRGESVKDYRLYTHPAQQRWIELLGRMAGSRPMELPWGYDGCAIPSIAFPLHRIALAMARFGDGTGLSEKEAAAAAQVRAAIAEHPYLIAGRERLCTDLAQRKAPRVLAKVGADGVYTACLPEEGIGVALKIDSGNTRAANVALGAVLLALGVLDDSDLHALGEYVSPSLANSRGDIIGRLESSSEWQGFARA